MTAQCVAVATVAGSQVIVPDDTCSAALVLVDSATYATLATNPLLIPIEAAPVLMLATLGLFIAAYSIRKANEALD